MFRATHFCPQAPFFFFTKDKCAAKLRSLGYITAIGTYVKGYKAGTILAWREVVDYIILDISQFTS